MLRAGLLEGIVVATAGGAAHVASACGALGATTVALEADLGDEDAVIAAACALGAVGTLVCDAATAFAEAGGGVEGLGAGLDGAWNATRAVANAAWIPGDGGKLVLLGPRPRDGAHAARARRGAGEHGAHAVDRVGALRDPHRRDPARRRHQRRRRRHARRLPRVAGGRLLQRLRLRHGIDHLGFGAHPS